MGQMKSLWEELNQKSQDHAEADMYLEELQLKLNMPERATEVSNMGDK